MGKIFKSLRKKNNLSSNTSSDYETTPKEKDPLEELKLEQKR